MGLKKVSFFGLRNGVLLERCPHFRGVLRGGFLSYQACRQLSRGWMNNALLPCLRQTQPVIVGPLVGPLYCGHCVVCEALMGGCCIHVLSFPRTNTYMYFSHHQDLIHPMISHSYLLMIDTSIYVCTSRCVQIKFQSDILLWHVR